MCFIKLSKVGNWWLLSGNSLQSPLIEQDFGVRVNKVHLGRYFALFNCKCRLDDTGKASSTFNILVE